MNGTAPQLPHDIKGLTPYVQPLWVSAAQALAVLAVLALLVLGFRWWRRRRRAAAPAVAPVDPWETLAEKVGALAPGAPFTGKTAEDFFYQLSLILREAIELKTSVRATDLTFAELREPLRQKLPLPRGEAEAVLGFLERADLVKFAGAPSTADEALQARSRVKEWVTRLKPLSIDRAPPSGTVPAALLLLLGAAAATLGAPRALATSLRSAHKAYESGDYATAEGGFAEAEKETPDHPDNTYNRAVTQYRQGKLGDAEKGFAKAAESTDKRLAEESYYNLGNTQVGLGHLDEAIKAYESALAIEPKDKEAGENLDYVKKLKQQQQQQKQQQNQQQKQQQQNQQQQKQQNQQQQQPQQDQQQQDQQQHQDQQQQQQQQKNQEQQQQQDQQQPDHDHKSQQQEKEPQQNQQQQQAQDRQNQEKDQKQPAPQEQQREQQSGGEPQQQQDMAGEEADKILRSVDDNVKRYLFVPPKDRRDVKRPEKDW